MKIEKKIIKESLGDSSSSKNTYSSKKQNIVITENQLERLLIKLKK
jgi:hypothetical protein